ncbi:MAG: class I tRNA ligase family protein, partial [Nitrosopumilus sp.]
MEFYTKFDAKAIESQVKEHIKSIDLEKEIFSSDKPEKIRFIEGPPTMNGIPHAGHLRGRVIKDLWYRFNTLQGKKIEFNGGWDTQGLPVELQVEKELGVTGGKTEAINQFGIERIVSECKKVVEKYNKTWIKVDELLGMSFNHDKAYWTFRDEFIEREWQVLKKAHANGILEEDFTVIAYCPSCQTSLSHAEVNQGYEEVKDPSLYYKVKLVEEDAFLIVWTTMPFTLVTDAMVGLQPQEDYVYVKVENETWIIGKARLKELMAEIKVEKYEIKKTIKGIELEGKKYIHPLLDLIPELNEYAKADNFHVAVSESFVDASTGSGLVHLSPANGEEDIKIANKRNVKIFNPIDDEVKFTLQAGKYNGMFVRDADRIIVEDLKNCNALVKIGKIKHKYPLCWRSHHPIVWLARRGWFYKLDRLDNKAIDAAESVEYFFEQPKNRFLGIIKEKHPWCISRERVWGCPLPVWNCEDCNEKNWFFTRKEIIEAAENLPDGTEFEGYVRGTRAVHY